MSRLRRILLSLNSLSKALGYANLYQATKFDYHIQIKKNLDFKKVLCLAPHPDDDTFGMGGTIKKMTISGVQVTVAYFCDGSSGTPDGIIDKKLIEVRKNEAKEAGKILGISEQVFFSYPDGKLAAGGASIRVLSDLIERINPDIIFLPSFLDNHPDHRIVNEILINTLTRMKIDEILLWGYEVWTPAFINRLSEISLYIKTKQEAILAHRSQLKCRPYDKAITGLNQYRGGMLATGDFAEGFFAMPFKMYKDLYRKS